MIKIENYKIDGSDDYIYVDIAAPLYWWNEFDTYDAGTVLNPCSTMHKIHAKEFTIDDFSHEHLVSDNIMLGTVTKLNARHNYDYKACLNVIIGVLNAAVDNYLSTKDEIYWLQVIQLLPSSYNQRRTIMLNREVLSNVYFNCKDSELDEWKDFCEWIKSLEEDE